MMIERGGGRTANVTRSSLRVRPVSRPARFRRRSRSSTTCPSQDPADVLQNA